MYTGIARYISYVEAGGVVREGDVHSTLIRSMEVCSEREGEKRAEGEEAGPRGYEGNERSGISMI